MLSLKCKILETIKNLKAHTVTDQNLTAVQSDSDDYQLSDMIHTNAMITAISYRLYNLATLCIMNEW